MITLSPFGLEIQLLHDCDENVNVTLLEINIDFMFKFDDHVADICKKACVKERQDRLPTMYWLPKLHKRPYKARFIANSSSCSRTELSKLLTSSLTDSVRKFMKSQVNFCFGQLKILVRYLMN